MLLIPAIDIREGRCVRLVQGEMGSATVYAEDPLTQANRWVDAGASRLHIVDLDGALEGAPVNAAKVGQIAKNHPEIEIQVGGGIRNVDTVQQYLDEGVDFVIVGTRAVHEPEFVLEISSRFEDTVIVGIDVRNNAVATDGWEKAQRTDVIALAQTLQANGAVSIIYTDIERDGMLSGVNVVATADLAKQVEIPVIAAGGVRDLKDIQRLLDCTDPAIFGAIAGKSLYEGTLDYAQGVRLIEQHVAKTVQAVF